jgi:hypothetical protein
MCTETDFGSVLHHCQILTDSNTVFWHTVVNLTNITFHENLFSSSQFVTCKQTNEQTNKVKTVQEFFASVNCKSSQKYKYWYSCTFQHISLFKKNKRKLIGPPCCLSVNPLFITASLLPLLKKKSLLRSPCCPSTCGSLLIIARQWSSKHIPTEITTCATIEELLGVSFSLQSMPHQRKKVGNYFFPEFFFNLGALQLYILYHVGGTC